MVPFFFFFSCVWTSLPKDRDTNTKISPLRYRAGNPLVSSFLNMAPKVKKEGTFIFDNNVLNRRNSVNVSHDTFINITRTSSTPILTG